MIPKLNSSAKQTLMISQFLWVRNLGMTKLGVSASRCLLRIGSIFHRLDCSSLKARLREDSLPGSLMWYGGPLKSAFQLTYKDLSTGLPHDVAAGFPQSWERARDSSRDESHFLQVTSHHCCHILLYDLTCCIPFKVWRYNHNITLRLMTNSGCKIPFVKNKTKKQSS